ncbi:hypothetical protein [Roseibacillus persicicus]|uniref:hypothetical protein n=1 Tax=Roseibacillus persicicus TaxID=454148 RepID=UPI00280EB185|nr:hypothetical protein [Roseibacillus persicicus]MDQ8192197.1 hypothetical protein [Roseibacillus persicicus]
MKHFFLIACCIGTGFGLSWLLKPYEPESHSVATTPTKSSRPIREDRGAISLYSKAPDDIRSRLLQLNALPTTRDRYRAAYAMIHSLSEEELKTWLDGNYNEIEGDLGGFLFNALIERLLVVDPEWVCNLALDKRFSHLTCRRVLSTWAALDPEASLAYVSESSRWDQQGHFLINVLETIARNEPDFLQAQLDGLLSHGQIPEYYLEQAFQILAAHNSDLFWESQQIWPPKYQNRALKAFVANKFHQDFEGALAWVEEAQLSEKNDLVSFSQLLWKHPEIASDYLAHFDELPSSWQQDNYAWRRAIETLAKEDLPKALDFLSQNDFKNPEKVAESYTKLAEKYGSQIIESILENSNLNEESLNQALRQSYLQLAETQPTEASKFLAAIASEEVRLEAIAEWEPLQEKAKLPYLPNLPTSDWLATVSPVQLDDDFASQIAGLPSQEVSALIANYQSIQGERKEHLNKFLADHSYHLPFELRAAWLAETQSSSNVSNHFNSLAQQWAAHSPLEAAAWFESLPPENQNESTGQSILGQWRQMNEEEADAWAAKHLPASENPSSN